MQKMHNYLTRFKAHLIKESNQNGDFAEHETQEYYDDYPPYFSFYSGGGIEIMAGEGDEVFYCGNPEEFETKIEEVLKKTDS